MPNNGQTASYIPDGYTEDVYFREFKGVHDEFRATYRPLSINQHSAVNRDLDQAGDNWERRNMVAARWISQLVISWNLKNPVTKEDVDHRNVAEVGHMRPAIFTRLWNVINNTDGGDVDPMASDFEMQRRAETDMVTSEAGLGRQEALEKN